MPQRPRYLVFLLLSWISLTGLAQKQIVQFSGFIRDVESSSIVPYAAVYIQDKNQGTISGSDGFFTFAAAKGDTILIKSLGYKPFKVVIPQDIEGTSFSREILLERDVIELKGVTIRPLPEPNQLRQAMINLDIPDNMAELAQQTIANSIIDDEIERNTRYDGAENYNQYVKQQTQYYYNRFGNQRPGISLTNPFAWAEFIKAIKNGDFKRKK
jgi:signal peptidase I